MDNKLKPVIVLGSGGHASVLIDILTQKNIEIIAMVAPDEGSSRQVFSGIPHLKYDSDILNYKASDIALVNGIGSLPGSFLRKKLFDYFSGMGYQFDSVISLNSYVSKFATLAEGAQVCTGAIIQAGAFIGPNSIINTGAIIEHDCIVGANNHISPGAVLSGEVVTGENVHVGTGANVIQGITIGEKSVVAAGASINKDLQARHVAYSFKPFITDNGVL